METPSSWVDVVNDGRLSGDACLCLLYLMSLGEGEHEVGQRTWRRILRHGSRERVRDALGFLQDLGMVTRKNGGRRPDTWSLWGGIQPHNPTLQLLSGGIPPHKPDLSGGIPPHKPFMGRESAPQNDTGVGVMEEVEGKKESARARDQLLEPVRRTLEKYDQVLTGCRDSLCDYLVTRVRPDRQRAYVFTVVALLKGDHAFRSYEGKFVTPTQAEMGSAFRELLTADEIAMKAPVGDIRNLQTKLRFIIRQGESSGDRNPNADTFKALDAASS